MAETVALYLFEATTFAEAAAFIASNAAIINAVATYVATSTYGSYQQRRAAAAARASARAALDASLQDRTLVVRSAVSPRTLIVGSVRTGGVLSYADTVGTNQAMLDTVLTIAGYEVSSVAGVFAGDEFIPASSLSNNQPTTGRYAVRATATATEVFTFDSSGSFTLQHTPVNLASVHLVQQYDTQLESGSRTEAFAVAINSLSGNTISFNPSGLAGRTASVDYTYATGDAAFTDAAMSLQWRLGTTSQAATSWPVATPNWGSDHRQYGCAYLRAILNWSEAIYAETGAPQLNVLASGPGPVYDPRTSGTTAGSSNPALLAAWYMTLPRADGGMGIPSSWIDWSTVATAANICDETITVRKLDNTGYEQVKRYACHAQLSTDSAPVDNLDIILSAMAGSRMFSGGTYRIYAGAYRTPTLTLTDDDVVHDEPIRFVPTSGQDSPPNVVTAQFQDSSRNWVATDAPPVVNTDYVTAAGGVEEVANMGALPSNDARQANYLMGVHLELLRPAMECTVTVGGIGADIELGRTLQVNLTHYSQMAGKTWEVVRRGNAFNGRYSLRLREMRANSYALNADRFTPSNPTPVADTSYLWNVDTITGLGYASGNTVGKVQADGTVLPGLRVTWSLHSQAYVRQSGNVEVRYRTTASTEWQYLPAVPGDQTQATVLGLQVGPVVVQARAVNGLGAPSTWSAPLLALVQGVQQPAADVASLTGTVVKGGIVWAWLDDTEPTYGATLLRAGGSDWASATPLWSGRANSYLQRVTTAGTYTVRARHSTRSFQPSTNTASATVTVSASDLVVDGAQGAQGPQGPQGPQGSQGMQGPRGADGTGTYFHVAYAYSADGSSGFNQSSGPYIGTYVDNVATDSQSYNAYTWRQFQGSQGPQGTQGIPGNNGNNGQTSYLHIKYSNDGGVTFTSNSGEDPGTWLGQVVDFSAGDPGSPGAYTWTKVEGPQGAQGPQGPQGSQGVQGPRGADGVSTYFHVAYAYSADGSASFNQSAGPYIGTYVDTTATDSTDYTRYTWRQFQGSQGPQGTQGIPGSTGPNGTPSYLHIKYSNDGGATFTANSGEDVGTWIGQYVDATTNDSTNPAAYAWAKLQGEPGGGASNLLYNADFAAGLSGWEVVGSSGITASSGSYGINLNTSWYLSPFNGPGVNALWAVQNGGSTNQSYYFEFGPSNGTPVLPGVRYVASAYTGAHRCKVSVFMFVFNASGAIIANSTLSDNAAEALGGQQLSGYKRLASVLTMPSGAAYVKFIARKWATYSGETSSYLFLAQCQLEAVDANTSAPSAWSPGASAYLGVESVRTVNIATDGVSVTWSQADADGTGHSTIA